MVLHSYGTTLSEGLLIFLAMITNREMTTMLHWICFQRQNSYLLTCLLYLPTLLLTYRLTYLHTVFLFTCELSYLQLITYLLTYTFSFLVTYIVLLTYLLTCILCYLIAQLLYFLFFYSLFLIFSLLLIYSLPYYLFTSLYTHFLP